MENIIEERKESPERDEENKESPEEIKDDSSEDIELADELELGQEINMPFVAPVQ